MMTVQCPSCQKVYNIPETMTGRQVRCKACQTEFTIGSADASLSPSESAPQQAATAAPRPAAPVGSMQSRGPRAAAPKSGMNMIMIGGAAVALLGLAALGYFVVLPMITGGQPAWTKSLMPKGTQGLGYIDLTSIRESKLYTKAMELAKTQTGGADIDQQLQDMLDQMGMKTTLKFDDIESVFFAGSRLQDPDAKVVVGLRVVRRMILKDLVSGTGVVPMKHAGKDYVSVGGAAFIAQLDDTTFCGAQTEALLKSALDRVESGAVVDLNPELDSLVKAVSREDSFLAGSISMFSLGPGAPPGAKSIGLGFSMNGSVDLTGIASFADSAKAEKAYDELEKGLEEGKKQLEEMAKMIKPFETVRKWLDDVDISQSGNKVEIGLSIDADDILEMIDAFESMAGSGGGPGPGPSPFPRF